MPPSSRARPSRSAATAPSTDTAADFALAHLKLTRNDGQGPAAPAGAATRIAAAMTGQIAGTMEQYPDTAELARHGFHVLVDLTEMAGDYPKHVPTRRAGPFSRTGRRWVKAILHGGWRPRYATTSATPRSRSRLTQKKFLEVKDAANAKAAYEAYSKVYPDDLRPVARRRRAGAQGDRQDRSQGGRHEARAVRRIRPRSMRLAGEGLLQAAQRRPN